jgi:hypothetical protein
MQSSSRLFNSFVLPLGLALAIISMVAMALLTHSTPAQAVPQQHTATSANADADINADHEVAGPVRFIVELKDPALVNYRGSIVRVIAY